DAKDASDQGRSETFNRTEANTDQSRATTIRFEAENNTIAPAIWVFTRFPRATTAGTNTPLKNGDWRGLKVTATRPGTKHAFRPGPRGSFSLRRVKAKEEV